MDGQPATGTVGGWRLLRGVAVGAIATTQAVLGHSVAGGQPPSWSMLAAATVAIGTASIVLSRLRWTLPRLLALLLAGQYGLHALFGVHPPQPHAGPLHTGVPEPTATLPPDGVELLAGHVLAAVGTALVLRQGERWLCAVVDALGLRAVRLLGIALAVYTARPQPVRVRDAERPRSYTPDDAWWQRGPPR